MQKFCYGIGKSINRSVIPYIYRINVIGPESLYGAKYLLNFICFKTLSDIKEKKVNCNVFLL